MDWMVVRIPFQYIAAFIGSLRDGCARGAEDSGDTTSLRAVAMASLLRELSFMAYATFVFNKLKF